MNTDRDSSIDFFRFIGIACIILAHCEAPWYVFEARNFDVPLMVFVSGYCAVRYSSKSRSFKEYVTDRFIRLIVPTWIFLTVYLIGLAVFASPLPATEVMCSYLMIGGPVGVWIIRIFFFMSVLTPAILHMVRKKPSPVVPILLLLVNEAFIWGYRSLEPGFSTEAFSILFVYNFAYACALFIGASWQHLKKKAQVSYVCIFFIIFLSYFFGLHHQKGSLILMQAYKMPPALYYLSYALFVSCILFIIKEGSIVKTLSRVRWVSFIGSHSLWIYLWHWVYLSAHDALFHSSRIWLVKFIFTLGLAAVTAFFQEVLVKKLAGRRLRRHSYVLKKVFVG